MVKVRYDEGVAIRIGPEPCVSVRENVGEASIGERIGQPSSRESYISRAPTALSSRKARWAGTLSRVSVWPGVVVDPGMCGRSLYGNREISGSAEGQFGRSVRGNGKYTYIEYARFADDLVILIDAYKRHDWLIGAVEKRLREEFG